MKQLKTFTGGHPFSLDDLTHVQAGVTEALIALMKGLSSNGASIPNCKLYGCDVTYYGNGTGDVTAGAVVLDGEICLFPGVTAFDFDVAPNIAVFAPLDQYAANNPVTYANATTQNVHLIRTAQITAVPTVGATHLLANGPSFITLIKSNFTNSSDNWKYIGVGSAPAFLNGFDNGTLTYAVDALRFRKEGANVIVTGDIAFNPLHAVTLGTPLNVFQLPVGNRPLSERTLIHQVTLQAGTATFLITFKTNGDVQAKAVALSSGMVVADLDDQYGGTPFEKILII